MLKKDEKEVFTCGECTYNKKVIPTTDYTKSTHSTTDVYNGHLKLQNATTNKDSDSIKRSTTAYNGYTSNDKNITVTSTSNDANRENFTMKVTTKLNSIVTIPTISINISKITITSLTKIGTVFNIPSDSYGISIKYNAYDKMKTRKSDVNLTNIIFYMIKLLLASITSYIKDK